MPSQSKSPTTTVNAKALNAKPALFQLPPGLYALRLMGSSQGDRVNPMGLSVAPGSSAKVDFLAAAGIVENTFKKVHDCIVVRVIGEPVTLVATEFHQGAPLSARLEIERIDIVKSAQTGQQQVPQQAPQQAQQQVPINSSAANPSFEPDEAPIDLRLLGHIEGSGDVIVQNDWLGDPDSDNRLEGFAMMAKGLPASVKLVYGCKFLSPKMKSQVTNDGKFVGTRQKALAIGSVVFGLEGEGAELFTITGELVFSGQHVCEITPATQLRGPTGNEHLVAIQLQITPKASRATRVSRATRAYQSSIAPQPESIVATPSSELRQSREEQMRFSGDDDGAWSDDDIAEIFGR